MTNKECVYGLTKFWLGCGIYIEVDSL